MENESLYTRRAELYDAIYSQKPYDKEAARVHQLLEQRGVADGSRLIEAACGTGSYLFHLKRWYPVAGLDLHPGILEVARKKLPGADLFEADMADFAVEQPFDALVCLFSSIGYLHGEDRLAAAAGCFARALGPEGVLIVEPFLEPEAFNAGRLVHQTHEGARLCCTRACIPAREDERAVLDFHWLVLKAGRAAVEHFVDRHELWMCEHQRMREIFEQAGFSVTLEPDGLTPGRDLLIGIRNPE
jgi:SAM-dependent methyltransferase